jgi:hypothetical protein
MDTNNSESKNTQFCQMDVSGSFSDKQIEKLAHKNFPYGSTSTVGSRDRSLYEQRKESFINGFNASQNYR